MTTHSPKLSKASEPHPLSPTSPPKDSVPPETIQNQLLAFMAMTVRPTPEPPDCKESLQTNEPAANPSTKYPEHDVPQMPTTYSRFFESSDQRLHPSRIYGIHIFHMMRES